MLVKGTVRPEDLNCRGTNSGYASPAQGFLWAFLSGPGLPSKVTTAQPPLLCFITVMQMCSVLPTCTILH